MYLAALFCMTTYVHAGFWSSTPIGYKCTEPHEGKTGNECYTINIVTRSQGCVSTNQTWHGSLLHVKTVLKNAKGAKGQRFCEVQPYNCETHGDCGGGKGVSLPSKDSRYVVEVCVKEQGDGPKRQEANVYSLGPEEQTCHQGIWRSMYRFGLEFITALVLTRLYAVGSGDH